MSSYDFVSERSNGSHTSSFVRSSGSFFGFSRRRFVRSYDSSSTRTGFAFVCSTSLLGFSDAPGSARYNVGVERRFVSASERSGCSGHSSDSRCGSARRRFVLYSGARRRCSGVRCDVIARSYGRYSD